MGASGSALRVLYVSRSFGLHDRRLCDGLERAGADVTVVSLVARSSLAAGNDPRVVVNLGLDAHASTKQLDEAISRLAAITERVAPGIVLAGPVTDGGYLAARARGAAPVVLQSWAFDVFWETDIDAAARDRARTALGLCDGLFADCNAVVARCSELAGRDFPWTFRMPWGISPDMASCDVDMQIASRLNLHGRKILLCTRGLEPIYGVATLLEAFDRVHREEPEAVLVWAGNGSLFTAAQTFVRDRELQESVRLLGAVDPRTIRSLFAVADCYVSCSLCDGTSVSLLEALSRGVPVVVTRAGGSPEWVEHGKNGWLCRGGDATDFARAIIEAAKMPDGQRRRIGAANRIRVENCADLAKNMPSFAAFLSSVTRPNGP